MLLKLRRARLLLAALIFAPQIADSATLESELVLGPGTGTLKYTQIGEIGLVWNFDWDQFKNTEPRMTLSVKVEGNDVIAGPFPEFGLPDETFKAIDVDYWKSPDRKSVLFVWEFFDFKRDAAPYWISMDSAGSLATELEVTLDYTVSPIPIPAAGVLFASALGLAGVIRRRRDQSQPSVSVERSA